ncbi:MAG: amino acid permease [Desulfuromonadales bacterium]|nr:amino acid permease [Desulfuromonadales bacterium]
MAHVRLKKQLKLLDIYAIGTGATLSAGFFLLPGLAAIEAGPGLVLAYMLAAVPMVPAMFSVIELATAMPRAGGVYYFLDRSLGPYVGTIGGIGAWLALVLKVSFALVGMGAYIYLFLPTLQIGPVAVAIALALGVVNYLGTGKSGGLQIAMVFSLLVLLLLFFGSGLLQFQPAHFDGFFAAGFNGILSTAGMVYISYVGVTKVASLSEEVTDPERNLPRAVILALATAVLVYGVGTSVMVGLIPLDELRSTLTPVAVAADYALGFPGVVLLSLAAMLAFVSVANAGLLSATRYPLAMSRDHLVSSRLRRLSRYDTPSHSILVTVGAIILVILLLDPMRIAKLASSFQLLLDALVCFAVIVMRESQIKSYDPGYRSPWYPWMQLAGIALPLLLIFQMGALSIWFSVALVVVASGWYFGYVRRRVNRAGAIFHVFERLGRGKHDDLDTELRGILREKGLRAEDPFDEIVLRSQVIDLDRACDFDEVVGMTAVRLRDVVPLREAEICKQIMDGNKVGATPVTRGVALPHFRSDKIERADMVLVRARDGVRIRLYNPLTYAEEGEEVVKALFFLVSPDQNPTQHLRILARIAERVDEESFLGEWTLAQTDDELRQSLLHDDHFLLLNVSLHDRTAQMIDQPLRDLAIPRGCLVVMLTRDGQAFVPDGSTVIRAGDRLMVIGEKSGLEALESVYLAD